jgi:hypothetical protein
MDSFEVRQKDGTASRARGITYQDAADHVARRQSGRRCVAERITGTKDKSGWFSAYTPAPGGGLSSTGDPFHLARW